jgi:hypothetical protein
MADSIEAQAAARSFHVGALGTTGAAVTIGTGGN